MDYEKLHGNFGRLFKPNKVKMKRNEENDNMLRGWDERWGVREGAFFYWARVTMACNRASLSHHYASLIRALQAQRKILARAQLGTAAAAEANPLIHGCRIHFNLDGKSVADNRKALCQHTLREETYWYSYLGVEGGGGARSASTQRNKKCNF